jgi:hypothetical protein
MSLSDLQKKLEKESQGIMFPFSANTSTVSTTQNVYDSSTDGIMTMTGQKYVGPDAVVQYGTEEQGFPRNLKQIEAPMLPQVSNLPPQGTGIMEAGPGTSTPSPIVEKTKIDPCPPGFKLINGVCQPIEQQPQQDRGGRDKPTFTGPKINSSGVIEGYTGVLGRDRPTAGRYDAISEEYGKAVADKVFEVNRTYRNRGAQLKAIDEAEKNRILNVYGEDRLNKDYVEGNNGVFYRVVATSPTLKELAKDAAIAVGEIIKDVVDQGPIIPKIVNDFVDYFNKDKPSKDFGKFAGANTFGQLQRNIDVANLDIKAATEALQQIANSTKYREERTDDQIDGDILAQQRKIDKARETINESNDMMQGTSQKEDRERAAQIARERNTPEELARKAAQRKAEKDTRAKQGGFKSPEQRTENFKKMTQNIRNFRNSRR